MSAYIYSFWQQLAVTEKSRKIITDDDKRANDGDIPLNIIMRRPHP